jgi:hypothetical protein
MTALASLAPSVIDYLVTTCQASANLGAASPPVTVVDGPAVTDDVMANQRILWIGYDRASPGEAVVSTQLDWPNLDQARTDDEQGELTCTAEFWSGDTTTKTNRDGCAAIVNAVAELLKGTPNSSGPGDTTMGGLVFWSRVSATSWPQQQNPDGATVLCIFKVAWYGRIAP